MFLLWLLVLVSQSQLIKAFYHFLCCVVLWYGMVWYGMVCVILGPVVEVEEEEVIRCSCYGWNCDGAEDLFLTVAE